MRALGFLGALLVGFVLWGVTLALSGGAYPLGKAGSTEAVLFFTPLVTFAFPLSLMIFERGQVLTGIWILATAPLLGLLNFAIAIGVAATGAVDWDKTQTFTLLLLAGGWLLILRVAVAAMGPLESRAEDAPPGGK